MKMHMVLRAEARHSKREGLLTKEQYEIVMDAIRHPDRQKKDGTKVNLIEEIEKYTTSQMGVQGRLIDWASVKQWFKDHWLQIIQTICSIISVCIIIGI